MKTIKRWVKNFVAIVMIYVVGVMMAGAFMAYGCFNRIGDDEVLDAAEQAYWERRVARHKLTDKSPQVIFCSQPESVVDYFWGIPLGWEWEARCSYNAGGELMAHDTFHINECKTTRLWQSHRS